MADAEGRGVASTGKLLEGQNVAARPWFREGSKRAWIGDVHGALLLSALLPREPGGGALRLLDFAAPWRRDGQPSGVVGAHLSLRWAEETRQAALATIDPGRRVGLLLISRDGSVVLGPAEPAVPAGLLAGTRPGTGHDGSGARLVAWGDGPRYFTATLPAGRDSVADSLGWTVVARQPEATAMAAAVSIQQRLWALGATAAVLFGLAGWWLAGRLTEPLARLAQQARRIVPGGPGGPGDPSPLHDEVQQLALTLSALHGQLHAGGQALADSEAAVEARVQQRTRDLQQANDDLQSYGRNVSHDLKGPIGGIGTLLRLLRQQHGERLDEGALRSLDVLVHECDRLGLLIDELLALAMVEQREVHREPVAMRELAEDVLESLRTTPDTRAARKATVTFGELPALQGDAVLLRQVWQNLLANAVKFSARVAAPHIEVSARQVGTEWHFCVADNGAGFEPSQARRLFGVFQRLHRATDFAGSGVGLSIVKRIVQSHGGRVWAEGQPGRGARFWFALPVDGEAVATDLAALG